MKVSRLRGRGRGLIDVDARADPPQPLGGSVGTTRGAIAPRFAVEWKAIQTVRSREGEPPAAPRSVGGEQGEIRSVRRAIKVEREDALLDSDLVRRRPDGAHGDRAALRR